MQAKVLGIENCREQSATEQRAIKAIELKRDMTEESKKNFWDQLATKAGLIHYLLVFVVGVVSVWTTNALTQQQMRSDIETVKTGVVTLQNTMDLKSSYRDKDNEQIKNDLKNTYVTKEVLNLTLKPIIDEQAKQGGTIERIAIAVNAPRSPYNGGQ